MDQQVAPFYLLLTHKTIPVLSNITAVLIHGSHTPHLTRKQMFCNCRYNFGMCVCSWTNLASGPRVMLSLGGSLWQECFTAPQLRKAICRNMWLESSLRFIRPVRVLAEQGDTRWDKQHLYSTSVRNAGCGTFGQKLKLLTPNDLSINSKGFQFRS